MGGTRRETVNGGGDGRAIDVGRGLGAAGGRVASRAPTMADVARLAGVSLTTVSFVINNRPDTGLRLDTQERVRAAIAELGYRPNQQAQALVRRISRTIGFIGEAIGTPFGGRTISGAHDRARAHESMLLILDAEETSELADAVADLLARQVDAIVVATEGSKRIGLPEEIARVPAVLINCYTAGGWLPSLLPNEELGGRAAARMLIAAGQLPAQKVDSMWIVTAEDARAFKRLPRGKAGAPRKLK